jgi:hypothetical protein
LPSFIRSICKLCCDGHGAYAKGDGKETKEWLRENDATLCSIVIGRAELGSRQDWVLETCAKILPLLESLTKYLVDSLVLDPNILRDSTLQRLELFHFQAAVHASAIMWECGFAEMRALTNLKTMDMNPMEGHFMYDRMWEMATLLQGPNALTVLDENYRPWPKVPPTPPPPSSLSVSLSCFLHHRPS